MLARAMVLGTALLLIPSGSAVRAEEIHRAGDLELHSAAVPTTELTPEAAKDYNVQVSPDRGLLTVTLLRKGRNGEARSVQGQVYAGAVTQNNYLISIPIREVRQGDQVYYLGEYRLKAPDTLRFIINANVLGRHLKGELTRVFQAP
jgi:hypothetical protein